MMDPILVVLDTYDPQQAMFIALNRLTHEHPFTVSDRSLELISTIAEKNAFDTYNNSLKWSFVFRVRY